MGLRDAKAHRQFRHSHIREVSAALSPTCTHSYHIRKLTTTHNSGKRLVHTQGILSRDWKIVAGPVLFTESYFPSGNIAPGRKSLPELVLVVEGCRNMPIRGIQSAQNQSGATNYLGWMIGWPMSVWSCLHKQHVRTHLMRSRGVSAQRCRTIKV